MRISDWSSDVCSSDLLSPRRGRPYLLTLYLGLLVLLDEPQLEDIADADYANKVTVREHGHVACPLFRHLALHVGHGILACGGQPSDRHPGAERQVQCIPAARNNEPDHVALDRQDEIGRESGRERE